MSPPAEHAHGYLGLLRENRDFRLLYIATLISLAGDWFLTVALLDLVLAQSGSAALASLMVLCQTLPVALAAPFAGPVLDRVDRRRLMIWVDVLRAFAALLPLLARSPGTLAFAYVGTLLISLGSAYVDPASEAALPNLVRPVDLARANVLFGSTWGTMLAAGASLGGVVALRFGRDVCFALDALSFFAAAWLVMRIRAPFSEARPHHEDDASMREAWRYARAHPRVLALLSCKGGYGLGAGVVAMLSVFGREVFQRGAMGIGLLFAARGLGALLGPFLIRSAGGAPERQYRLIALATFLFGLGYLGLAFSPWLWPGAAMVMVAHLGGGAQWQTSTLGLQREVPDRLRGRIFAIDYGLVTLTMSVSSLLTGVLSDRIGPVRATMAPAAVCILFALGWGVLTYRVFQREEGRAAAGPP